jgi:hypothetical protein
MIDRKSAAPSLKPGESKTARYFPLMRSTQVTSHGLAACGGAASASISPFVSGNAAAKDAAPNELKKSRRRMDMGKSPSGKHRKVRENHRQAAVSRQAKLPSWYRQSCPK